MHYTDDDFATILLTQHIFDVGVQPLSPAAFWKLCEKVGAPGSLIGLGANDLARWACASAEEGERLARLLDAMTGVALRLDQLNQSGIQTIAVLNGRLPALVDHLRTAAPPLLHVAGDLALLTARGVGIVGSRHVAEAGRDVSERVAGAAAESGFQVISGGARGVDQAAMKAAVERQGNAVGVLADSLTRQLRDADTRRLVGDGTVTLCTPYSPDAPFSVGSAMGRNKLIYAFAHATLVVATEVDTGGTWAGAKEALSKNYGRVMVWRGPGEGLGNGALETLGASPVATAEEFLHLAADGVRSLATANGEQLGLGL